MRNLYLKAIALLGVSTLSQPALSLSLIEYDNTFFNRSFFEYTCSFKTIDLRQTDDCIVSDRDFDLDILEQAKKLQQARKSKDPKSMAKRFFPELSGILALNDKKIDLIAKNYKKLTLTNMAINNTYLIYEADHISFPFKATVNWMTSFGTGQLHIDGVIDFKDPEFMALISKESIDAIDKSRMDQHPMANVVRASIYRFSSLPNQLMSKDNPFITSDPEGNLARDVRLRYGLDADVTEKTSQFLDTVVGPVIAAHMKLYVQMEKLLEYVHSQDFSGSSQNEENVDGQGVQIIQDFFKRFMEQLNENSQSENSEISVPGQNI